MTSEMLLNSQRRHTYIRLHRSKCTMKLYPLDMLLAVGGSDNLIGKGEEHPVLLRRLNRDLQIQGKFRTASNKEKNHDNVLIINQSIRNFHSILRSEDLRNGAADASRTSPSYIRLYILDKLHLGG